MGMPVHRDSFTPEPALGSLFFFGLQFFLSGISFIALDMISLSMFQPGLMNAAAFVPAPIMLEFFNLMVRNKDASWDFPLALLVFAGEDARRIGKDWAGRYFTVHYQGNRSSAACWGRSLHSSLRESWAS
jgi:hypothetical protein